MESNSVKKPCNQSNSGKSTNHGFKNQKFSMPSERFKQMAHGTNHRLDQSMTHRIDKATTQRRNDATKQPIVLLAPAKINLFLHVVGRRADGYHDLYSLMCCVSLYDRLVLTPEAPHDRIECDRLDLPCDETNLAFKALRVYNEALVRHTAVSPAQFHIHLFKKIPMGAGLGGGSSDAAAVLKALNAYYGHPLSRVQLHTLALHLGADVPFFIDGTPAIAEGVGERLTPCPNLPPLWAVLIYPDFCLSTAKIFKNLKLGLTKFKKKLRYFPFKNVFFSVPHHLHNDLEAAVGDCFPVIEALKQELMCQGAIGALMTGSGSTVYGLFANVEAAEKAQIALGQSNGRQVFVGRLLTEM
jgi:4-diphosphocytidyl-2-C-methyl-D-erythritol kinase